VVPANIRSATLWGEVVNYKQSLLRVKREDLKCVGRGGPRTWQVSPSHTGTEVPLFKCRHLALERYGLSDKVNGEIGITEYRAAGSSPQWEANCGWSQPNQSNAGSNRERHSLWLHGKLQFITA
jgi:hypothetical protein